MLGLGGLGVALGLLSRGSGPLATPESRVVLEDATATTLDTMAFRGRTIEASVRGIVVQIDAQSVWVTTGDDAFPLRLDAPDLEVEDHLLAVGRLRGRGGRRWLEVRSWSVLEAEVLPPGAGR
ncbi:hypothetical protein [Rubrivirga sp.]|uniref:hypothetical protein n=1 Tax=Rubrivirga sp. TaxID=1885344 RepID=UPI003C77A26A